MNMGGKLKITICLTKFYKSAFFGKLAFSFLTDEMKSNE